MKIKHLLTKTLLVAVALLGGANSAWAYTVPDGYEIKTVIFGTNNGDGTVTAEDFAETTATGWSLLSGVTPDANHSVAIANITEVAKPETGSSVGETKPTYVAGNCIALTERDRYDAIKYATYPFSAVSSGYLVFDADIFGDGNYPTYVRFVDSDGNAVLTMHWVNGNTSASRAFNYQIGTNADVSTSIGGKPRDYHGYGIRDLVINLGTGAATFKLDYINYSGVRTVSSDVALNIGTGKNIAGIQLGYSFNSGSTNYTQHSYMDNIKLYTVGVSAAATTYTVNAVSGGSTLQLLATSTASEGDEYSVYVPRVIEKNGDFYVWDEAESAPNYKKSYTMGSTSEVKEISYTKNTNIVAYIEGESAAGTNESYSNGSAGPVSGANHITSGRAFGTHPAGVYKFTVFVTGNDGRGIAVRNNSVDNSSNLYAQVRSEGTGKKEKTFVLPEERTLIVTGHHTEGVKTNQSGDFDYAILEYVEDLPATENIVVSSAGFATYVSNYNLDFTSTTTKAYKVSVESKGVATMTEVAKVPAKTPVLLYCDGGNASGEAIPVTTAAVEAVTGNDLVAGTGATVATTVDDYTNMILNNVGGNIGFYLANGRTVAANRAYLHFDSSLVPDAGAPMMLVFDGEATGISEIKTMRNAGNEIFFDLQGRKVAQPAKGLYIVNGRKVVIK